MMTGRPRDWRVVVYGTAAASFVAFAIWGSLFPFDVRGVPLGTANALFWMPWSSGPRWSITDLASNVILFMPIGLFVTAALEGTLDRATPRWFAAVGTLAFTLVLSVTVEFSQAFVPFRTPSIVDVMAESFGAIVGVAVWHAGRDVFNAAVAAAASALARASVPRRLLLLYSVIFAIAWLLPLDFTIRPHEIADKYVHLRLLTPLQPSPDAASVVDLGAALVGGVPLGAAAVLGGTAPGERRPLLVAMAATMPMLLILEAAQVTVFSRTTDMTSMLAVMAGALAGAVAAAFGPRFPGLNGTPNRRSRTTQHRAG